MAIRVCVAGVTGWTGSAVAKEVLRNENFQLTSAVARRCAGRDVGEALGLPAAGVVIDSSLEAALQKPVDVLIEYTSAHTVRQNVLYALEKKVAVVVGSSGLTAADYDEIDGVSRRHGVGVIAAGNFSITATLAKYAALLAARYLPTCEIIDYADDHKPDAPSGTTRELAEELAKVRANQIRVPVDTTFGAKEARGAQVAGAQLHSVRLPGYIFSFETIFGLPDERLVIRHDAGGGAQPYVAGTLLAAEKVMQASGLTRGLDKILFAPTGQ